MSLKLITAPSALAVSLAEAKLHLRVDGNDDDTLITAMIGAATQMAEQATGRAVMPQTWQLSQDEFPGAFELTRIPVQSVVSIVYTDASGADQTLDSLNYTLDNASDFGSAKVVPAYAKNWPASRTKVNAVRVQYVAGYADAASVPDSIKAWIKLMVGAMYENREAETIGMGGATSLGVADRLLDRYKVWAL
jgi:uncharacterized phiE125 gp8 family phage protein